MNEFMNFMVENGLMLFVLALCCIALVLHIMMFFQKPTEEQLTCLKNWLLGAVIEAEKEFGSNTGALKLRSVYDKFVVRLPWLAKLITFEQFSGYVDNALDEMEELLQSNKTIFQLVNFDKKED